MQKRPIEEVLEEVLEKLNVIMSYTYVSEKDTLMDIYQDLKKQQAELPVEVIKEEVPPDVTDELIAYAFATGKYQIKDNIMIIDHGTAIVKIPMEIVNARSKG